MPSQRSSVEQIRFHFDYISSNAYLAWVVLPELAAKYGRRLGLVPVVFAKLLEAHGTLGPAALVDALFKAVWAERRHVSEPDVVAGVARAVGLDGARIVADAQTPETKARLRRQTDEAIARGEHRKPPAGEPALGDRGWPPGSESVDLLLS